MGVAAGIVGTGRRNRSWPQALRRAAIAVAAVAGTSSAIAPRVHAEETDRRPAKGIQDNSFLIEEAYNQDAGVVQHIATLRRQDRGWFFAFTQEWPIGSQTHQFSYTLPYAWLRGDGERASGVGDVMLNYRWQALVETDRTPAFAPRFSLILPSGDADRDLGTGSTGYQISLPVSKVITDRVTVHGNAGLTSYLDVNGRSPTSYNLGGSAIYAVTRNFNLMLEAVGEWSETVDVAGEIERETSFTLSPGFRRGFDLSPGQLVVGVAAPIRFAGGTPDYGVFLYLSVEHSFLK